jgi:anti-sigma regulatory factor (Ser/Thr protein kinase)
VNELDVGELAANWSSLVDVELSGLAAPQQARWTIREQLAGVVSVPFLRDVMLATSELVTNAIRYAAGPCRLTMSRDAGSNRLRIGVADGNPELPQRVDRADDPTTSGRGLLIVDTVSSSWGTRSLAGGPQAGGKEVWFEMVPERHS